MTYSEVQKSRKRWLLASILFLLVLVSCFFLSGWIYTITSSVGIWGFIISICRVYFLWGCSVGTNQDEADLSTQMILQALDNKVAAITAALKTQPSIASKDINPKGETNE